MSTSPISVYLLTAERLKLGHPVSSAALPSLNTASFSSMVGDRAPSGAPCRSIEGTKLLVDRSPFGS